jgi:hypothetical protein
MLGIVLLDLEGDKAIVGRRSQQRSRLTATAVAVRAPADHRPQPLGQFEWLRRALRERVPHNLAAPASWNPIASWLKQIDGLRQTA